MDFGFSRVHVLNSCARLSSTLPVLNFPQKDYIFSFKCNNFPFKKTNFHKVHALHNYRYFRTSVNTFLIRTMVLGVKSLKL